MAHSWRGIGWAVAAGVVALAAVAGLAWWRFNQGEPVATEQAAGGSGRRRVAIPRPVRAAPEELAEGQDRADTERPGAEGPGAAAPGEAQPVASQHVIPEFHGAGPDLGATLKAEIGAVTPELVACLRDWATHQPDVFVGKATFSFRLDQDGVVEMNVLDVDAVPEPTLACLGDVLWEDVAWPSVDAPLEVTWPVQVSFSPDP
jgi:hypothetical protein